MRDQDLLRPPGGGSGPAARAWRGPPSGACASSADGCALRSAPGSRAASSRPGRRHHPPGALWRSAGRGGSRLGAARVSHGSREPGCRRRTRPVTSWASATAAATAGACGVRGASYWCSSAINRADGRRASPVARRGVSWCRPSNATLPYGPRTPWRRSVRPRGQPVRHPRSQPALPVAMPGRPITGRGAALHWGGGDQKGKLGGRVVEGTSLKAEGDGVRQQRGQRVSNLQRGSNTDAARRSPIRRRRRRRADRPHPNCVRLELHEVSS
jgi:hypothetical protein